MGKEIRKLLVVRFGDLGDILTATPALRATSESRSVLGPGIVSARSNSAWSSRWQK